MTHRSLRFLPAIAMFASLLVASVAAAVPPTRRPPEPRPSPGGGGGCQTGDGTRDVPVSWGNADHHQSCFFFSGPGTLGRDDHLGDRARLDRRGDRISLSFGNARFEGRINGDRVRLERRSDHQYGSRWTATEVIDGRLVAGAAGCPTLQASYTYEECDTASASSCPSVCYIRASLAISGI